MPLAASDLAGGPSVNDWPLNRFGEGVVITVADVSVRRLDASFCQSLGIPNGHVLNAAIRVIHEPAAMSGTPIMKCLLNGIQDKTCMCRPAPHYLNVGRAPAAGMPTTS